MFHDLSHLPAASPANRNGREPDPIFGPALANAYGALVDTTERPTAFDTKYRHSWAGNCARQLAYRFADTPISNPFDLADYYRFGIGQAVHDMAFGPAVEAFADDTRMILEEAPCQIDGFDGSGHADLWIVDNHATPDAYGIVVEGKTINGFGYKKIIKGDQGARTSHILQGALNAVALDADELRIVYFAMELLSPYEATRLGLSLTDRFTAEFRYERDTFTPLALAEVERVKMVMGHDDPLDVARQIPDPEIPADAVITDPSTGRWEVHEGDEIVLAGRTWHCAYCPFQKTCANDR